jgi:hypothetical protein
VYYVTAKRRDKIMDKGNNKIINMPIMTCENPTAIAASKTIRDKTPPTTAFLICKGELSL